MAAAYSENRPAFLGESLDSITVSIGESIVGATFAATMFDPSGTLVSGTIASNGTTLTNVYSEAGLCLLGAAMMGIWWLGKER